MIYGIGSRYANLEAWLPFDESSGALAELSGNRRPFTVTGATQNFDAGDLGRAIDFDGVDDHVTSTDSALLSIFDGSVEHTITFWAASTAYRIDQAAFGIGATDSNDNLAFYPYFDAGMGVTQIWLWVDGSYIFQVTTSLPADSTFHHYGLITRSATDHELYSQGVSIATSSTNKALAAIIAQITIGAYDDFTNEEFQGQVTIPKLWKRALTDAEMLQDFKYPQ